MRVVRHRPTSLTASRSFKKERRKVRRILLGFAAANASVSAAPTPGVELPKQGLISLADALVFADIYEVYFDQETDAPSVREVLKDAGVGAAVGGGVAYASVKLTEVVAAEIFNFIPVVGWLFSGAITASTTLTFGALWAGACEHSLRNGTSPAAEMQAQMRPAIA